MKKCESNLNPLAEEFVPPTRRRLSATAPELGHIRRPIVSDVAQAQRSRAQPGSSHAESESSSRIRKDKNAEKESKIKRTVYVRDIDPRITEKELIREFSNCGVVKGSCICGDTQSGLLYGFVEFENEDFAKAAMRLNCTRIGLYPVRVLPSHGNIAPRNRLPSHRWQLARRHLTNVEAHYWTQIRDLQPMSSLSDSNSFITDKQSFISQGGEPPNIKPSLIHLLRPKSVRGALNEDPHVHLAIFEEHCGTFAQEENELDNLKYL